MIIAVSSFSIHIIKTPKKKKTQKLICRWMLLFIFFSFFHSFILAVVDSVFFGNVNTFLIWRLCFSMDIFWNGIKAHHQFQFSISQLCLVSYSTSTMKVKKNIVFGKRDFSWFELFFFFKFVFHGEIESQMNNKENMTFWNKKKNCNSMKIYHVFFNAFCEWQYWYTKKL